MSLISKILSALCALAIAFAVGFFSGKSEVIKTNEKIVYKDKIVTIIRTVKPDGTVIEERREEDRSKEETKIVSKPSLGRYSVTALAVTRYDKLEVQYGAMVGMRLIDSLYVNAGMIPNNKEILVSLSYNL